MATLYDLNFGERICRHFGLKNVTKIVITCEAHEIPTIEVTSLVPADEGLKMLEIIQHYRFEKINEGE